MSSCSATSQTGVRCCCYKSHWGLRALEGYLVFPGLVPCCGCGLDWKKVAPRQMQSRHLDSSPGALGPHVVPSAAADYPQSHPQGQAILDFEKEVRLLVILVAQRLGHLCFFKYHSVLPCDYTSSGKPRQFYNICKHQIVIGPPPKMHSCLLLMNTGHTFPKLIYGFPIYMCLI